LLTFKTGASPPLPSSVNNNGDEDQECAGGCNYEGHKPISAVHRRATLLTWKQKQYASKLDAQGAFLTSP